MYHVSGTPYGLEDYVFMLSPRKVGIHGEGEEGGRGRLGKGGELNGGRRREKGEVGEGRKGGGRGGGRRRRREEGGRGTKEVEGGGKWGKVGRGG